MVEIHSTTLVKNRLTTLKGPPWREFADCSIARSPSTTKVALPSTLVGPFLSAGGKAGYSGTIVSFGLTLPEFHCQRSTNCDMTATSGWSLHVTQIRGRNDDIVVQPA